ncbi:MAG: hypothetical protein JO107_15100, partial [Hyphomicrobiales bacterium]|nr:hypothetical protein [Hyphomicrobiales bacterium]MBV8664419.1 hypothetical protein [Hyphomicrobiales bacterium]
LRRRSLIALGEEDPESGEFVIEIRSIVRYVAGEAYLLRLKRYSQETEQALDAAERSAASDGEDEDLGEPSRAIAGDQGDAHV